MSGMSNREFSLEIKLAQNSFTNGTSGISQDWPIGCITYGKSQQLSHRQIKDLPLECLDSLQNRSCSSPFLGLKPNLNRSETNERGSRQSINVYYRNYEKSSSFASLRLR